MPYVVHVWKSTSLIILTAYVWVNSSREHPPPKQTPLAYPGHLKKLFKCPALQAIFVGKCPARHSFCGGQMPSPPVHPINIKSYWLPYFNKHNCFSSIECIKQVTKWGTSTEKRQSKWFYCFYTCRSFIVNKCSLSTPKWLLETLDSECCRKWWQDVTKQVCCCLQMPAGLGHY